MVDAEILRRRLEKLDASLDYLKRAQAYSFNEFASDVEVHSAVERNLQLAIEALNDMASHVVADENLGTVERAQDLPALFAEHGLIDDDLRARWHDMVGFRNVLVHDYVELDRELVYDVLQEQLGDLQRLQSVFAEFL